MKVKISRTGPPLEEIMASLKGRVLAAGRQALDEAAEAAKRGIRDQIRAAGLGNRLPNAVGSRTWPAGKLAYAPAGLIYPRGEKAREILQAFSRGGEITAGQGRFLAIPTPDGLRLMGGRRGNPADALRKLRQGSVGRGDRRRVVIDRGLELAVIPLRRGGQAQAAVVAKGATYGKSGRVRAATAGRAARGLLEQPIVLFWLVKTVNLRKRISPEDVMQEAVASLPGRFAAALRAYGVTVA